MVYVLVSIETVIVIGLEVHVFIYLYVRSMKLALSIWCQNYNDIESNVSLRVSKEYI